MPLPDLPVKSSGSPEERISKLNDFLVASTGKAELLLARAEAYYRLSKLATNRGKHDEALAAADRSVVEAEKSTLGTRDIVLARALYRKGSVLDDLEDVQRAALAVDRAITILKRKATQGCALANKELSKALIIRIVIANVNFDYSLSQALLSRVELIPEALRDDFVNAQLPVYRAYVAKELNDLPESLALYHQFIQVRDGNIDRPNFGFALNQLGGLYLTKGDTARAIGYLAKASRFFRQRCQSTGGTGYDCVQLLNVTANEIGVFADQGRFDRAEAAYAMALDYLKPPIGEYKEGSVANLFSEFALAKSKAGDHRAASSLFDRSLSYLVEYPKTYGPAALPLLSDNVLYSRVGLVSWLLRKYEHFARQEPLAQRELALAVHDKLDSLLYFSWQQSNITPPRFAGDPRIRGHYEDVLKLLKILEEGTGTPEHYRAKAHQIIAKTKGNEMRRKMGQEGIALKAGLPPDAIAQRQAYALAAKMVQYDLAATRSDAHGPLLDSLLMVTTKLREYDQVLSQQYPGFKRALERPVLPPPAALNQVVAEDQVLIDYFLTDTLIFAVAYTQATAFQHYILPKPSAFSSWVAGHLTDEVAAAKLYQCLLEPIVNELPATVKRIQIIPDEQIWDVVFPALRHEDQHLIEHYALGFAYSWQSLYYTSKLKASKKRNFAGYGADYAFLNQPPTIASNRGFGLGALPAAPAEVQAAAGIFAGDYWTNEDATKMAFTDNYQDYGVLHCTPRTFGRVGPFQYFLGIREAQSGYLGPGSFAHE